MPVAGEPIALIGTGCRFPGNSTTPSRLWDLLREPRDLLEPLVDRFNSPGWYHRNGKHHGHTNVRDSYQLAGEGCHRRFDAQFFGINAVEANTMDPQMRLLLETVYEALEAAGQPMESLRGSDTAVYTGMMINGYKASMERDLDSMGTYHVSGVSRAMMANRLSYFFDWHGPSMTIDTACSSSLIAVHQAVMQLRSGQSRVAVAAGSNLLLDPADYLAMSNLEMLSPDGRSRMWDKDANGYARGEGIAAVVLKTLSAAEADGDHITCIIRETAINQDGRTPGITMPSAAAQTRLMRDCYARAGLDITNPDQRPQYFEAHGTGTPAGDPIEAEAIKTAFFPADDAIRRDGDKLLVGGVKTVIGHSESTAGLAGLIKTSLALQNCVVPPNLLFNEINPRVMPFYKNLEIPRSTIPWPAVRDGSPRRASVNSFGFGGANAHAILESYELPNQTKQDTKIPCAIPFVFSAASETSLRSNLLSMSDHLRLNDQHTNLRDLAMTLHSRRSRLPFGTTVSAGTVEELCRSLEEKAHEKPVGIRTHQPSDREHKPKILGVFTGQGAQSACMGATLITKFKTCEQIIDKLEARLDKLPVVDRPTWSLKQELLKDANSTRIGEATFSQPLCTALQIIQIDLLRAAGLEFSAVVGHSSGEIAAAYSSGIISAEDAICIAYYRGLYSHLAIGPTGKQGAMLAVGTSYEDAQDLCNEEEFQNRVSVAAINSSASVTMSGDEDAIEEIKIIFEDEKKFTRLLKVDKAYHSSHIESCSAAYIGSLQRLGIQPLAATTSWYSSVDEGAQMAPQELDRVQATYWNDNMVRPVKFMQAVQRAWESEGPFDLAVEIGPHPALRGPTLQTIQDLSMQDIPYTGVQARGEDSLESFMNALGYMWTRFTFLNLSGADSFLNGSSSFNLVTNLPPYAWDHDKEYWHESRHGAAVRMRSDPVHELLGHLTPDSTEQVVRWRNILCPKELTWLKDHALQQQSVFPAAGYVVAAIEAAARIARERELSVSLIEILDLDIGKALAFDSDDSRIETIVSVADIQVGEHAIDAQFTFDAASSTQGSSLNLLASGHIRISLGDADEGVLPVRCQPWPGLRRVDSTDFYASLERLDYQYTGPFRALFGLERKLGFATGNIATEKSGMLIHPAVLDAGFQSLLLAQCAPNSGALWSLHVPKKIRAIRVNPALCTASNENEGTAIPFYCSQPAGVSEMTGDVDMFTGRDAEHTMIQVEGLLCVPLSRPIAQDDKMIFSTIIWDVAAPDAEKVAHDGEPTRDQEELSYLLERMSIFFLRRLDREVPTEHPARTNGPYVHYFKYAAHILSLLEDSKLPLYSPHWAGDSEEDIAVASEPFLEIADVKLLKALGVNIIDIATEKAQAIEIGMQGDMLSQMYEYGLGFQEHTTYLARLVNQLVHRYPHMKILEVGAGTAGATKKVFHETRSRFASYTYTDISSGFFDSAQRMFAAQSDKMVYKVLDISKDIQKQGYEENSYDLVVASAVLHATPNLQDTLRNVRRLLKPGGYLIALELLVNDTARMGTIFGSLPGWWLGAEDGRTLSPCVNPSDWDSLLRTTGFSGCDTVTPIRNGLAMPMCVFVSQAMDSRMDFLRSPLDAHISLFSDDVSIAPQDLVLLGADSPHTLELLSQIKVLLGRQWGHDIRTVYSLADMASLDISAGTTIMSLLDLDEPVFEHLNNDNWESLKVLLHRTGTMLWVSSGCRAQNPHANMMIGLLRSVREEIPTLDIQCLDAEGKESLGAHELSEALLRWKATTMWQRQVANDRILMTAEPEMVREQDGTLRIPRVVANQEMNDRYNSSRRPIDAPANIGTANSDENIEISESDEQPVCLHRVPWPQLENGGSIVRVTHSLRSALRVAATSFLHLVLGSDDKSGHQVIALTSRHALVVAALSRLCIPVFVPAGSEEAFIVTLGYHLLASVFLEGLSEGMTAIVHEADTTFAAVIAEEAQRRGARVIFTTTSATTPMTGWIYIHPKAPERVIRALIPKDAALLNMSGSNASDSIGNRLHSLLPNSSQYYNLNSLFSSSSAWHSQSTISRVQSRFEESVFRTSAQLANAECETSAMPFDSLGQLGINHRLERTVIDWSSPPSELSVKVQPVDSQIRFLNHKTYWLAGLSGGLGLLLCEWMVRHGARYIVISSRRPNVPEQWLETMRSSGAVVEVLACDMTSQTEVSDLYHRIRTTMPVIAGVCQGAMVLEDTAIRDMALETLLRVTRPKVEGSLHLDQALQSQDEDLEFFIFFSSGGSIVGRPGQCNYAAANLFMTALAEQRRRRGQAASVMHIGPIFGVGYMTQQGMDMGKTWTTHMKTMFPISEQDFCHHFAEAVLLGRPGSNALSAEVASGLARLESSGEAGINPFLSHYIQDQVKTATDISVGKAKAPLKSQLAEASGRKQVANIIMEAFLVKLSALFQNDLSMLEQAAPEALRLDEMGIDSLIAVEIRSWFVKTLQVNIPVLKILSGSSVAELITIAAETIPKSFIPKCCEEEPDLQVEGNAQATDPVSTPLIQKDQTPVIDIEDSSSDDSCESLPHAATDSDDCQEGGEWQRGSYTPFTQPDQNDIDRIQLQLVPLQSNCDEKMVKLSFSQGLFWFSAAFSDHPSNLNLTASFILTGELNVEGMQNAVLALGQQHESLRTCFLEVDGQPMQRIMKSSHLSLEHYTIQKEHELTGYVDEIHNHVYNLEQGKTVRLALVSTSSSRHFFIIGVHHLAMDGQSFFPLMQDMLQHYTHSYQGMTAKQYSEYSEEQHSEFASGGYDDDLGFWRAKLAKMPPILPMLRTSQLVSRPTLQAYGNRCLDVSIEIGTKARIQSLCRRCRSTPFHFYLAVFRVLLFRFTGATDFSIGVGDANRSDELMGSIGDFVNLLPLVFRTEESSRFEAILQETRAETLSALANSRVPFQLLLSELGIERSAVTTPIFQAFMDYRLARGVKLDWGDCQMELLSFPQSKVAYDLAVDIIDNADGDCRLTFIARDDVYSQEDVKLFAESYVTLANAFAARPDESLGQVNAFNEDQIQEVLKLGRGRTYQPRQPWGDTVIHRIEDMMRIHSIRTAVISGGGNAISYDDISQTVSAVASELEANGISMGSRVAVLQEPTLAWVSSILAVMRIGATYVPLDVATPQARLTAIIEDCQPQAIIVDENTKDHIREIQHNMAVLTVSDGTRSTESRLPISATPDTVSMILYTSGSSGKPKGIVLTHRGIKAWLEPCEMLYGLRESGEVVLQQSSQGFDMSLMQIFTALCFGGSICLLPRELRGDARAIGAAIVRHGVTHTYGTPSEYFSWLKYSDSRALRESAWKTALVGGEPLAASVLKEFAGLGKPDLRFHHMYGTTESTFCATAIELDYATLSALEGSRPPGSQQTNFKAGEALPNYNVYILDEQRNPMPAGVQGEIYIGGAGVALGYLNNQALTAETFLPDPYATAADSARGWNTMQRTGDLGRWSRSDRGAILVEGRISGDTMVKLRGLRVDLREVEAALLHTGADMLSEAVVSVRRTNPESPEFLVAYVVFQKDWLRISETPQENALQQLRGRLQLPLYMRPAFITPVDALPRTSSGKLDRRAVSVLTTPESNNAEANSNATLTSTEEQLKDIWEQVLGSGTHLDSDTDFFHVGGTSLSLLSLRDNIRTHFKIELRILDLFEASVLSNMAHRIEGRINAKEVIDWEQETRLRPTMAQIDSSLLQHLPHPHHNKIVILTGGTGHLGKAFIRAMIRDASVKEIHCLGVRNSASRTDLIGLDKVILYEGDLTQPRMGLSPSVTEQLFSRAHVIIHNGADISYMKSYQSMRQSNFLSTKDLIEWSMPRMIPFHYISSAGIGNFAPGVVVRETSMAATEPPTDGSAGYTACKWASEVFLERLVERHPGWRVHIHRPTLISRDDIPELDGAHNILGYARKMGAVPSSKGVARGVFNVVQVDTVVSGVLACVSDDDGQKGHQCGGRPRYLNHIGKLDLPLNDMRKWALERTDDGYVDFSTDVDFDEIPLGEWIKRAGELGMHPAMGALLTTFARNGEVEFPTVVQGC